MSFITFFQCFFSTNTDNDKAETLGSSDKSVFFIGSTLTGLSGFLSALTAV
jgi:hypothetical protein